MSELLVNTIKKADGTGNLSVPAETGTVVTTAGATFTGDLTLESNGIYLGGTGSANFLDDYENGTWTATVTTSGYTITTQVLDYTKVGEIVHIYGKIKFSAVASNSSLVSFSGLPFARETTSYGIPGVVREASSYGYIYVLQIDGSGNFSINSYDGVSSGSNRIFETQKDYFISAHYKA